MMETSILNQLPFDPGFLILGLIGLVLILLIFLISTMVQLKSLTRKYDYFMRGKDAETLEDVIMDQIEEIRNLKDPKPESRRPGGKGFHPYLKP